MCVRALCSAVVLGLAVVAGPALPADASATVTNIRSMTPWTTSVAVPCAGEMVDASGRFHQHFNVVSDDAGGVHLVVHDNLQGASGVGRSSGDVYRAMSNSQFNMSMFESGALEFTSQLSVRYVSGDVHYVTDLHFHTTMTADGVVTSTLEDVTVTCG